MEHREHLHGVQRLAGVQRMQSFCGSRPSTGPLAGWVVATLGSITRRFSACVKAQKGLLMTDNGHVPILN